MNSSTAFAADAILPTLAFIWPITIVLFIPIVFIEGRYAQKKLNLATLQSIRIFGIANLISTIIGLPIASVLAGAFQKIVQIQTYGGREANWDRWSRTGNVAELSRAFGQYPRWTLLSAATLMLGICFLISWWTEAVYVKWEMNRKEEGTSSIKLDVSGVVRSANVLSYALLCVACLGLLSLL